MITELQKEIIKVNLVPTQSAPLKLYRKVFDEWRRARVSIWPIFWI